MDFRSDNVTGAHPRILEALVAANQDSVTSYGEDPISGRITRKLSEILRAIARCSQSRPARPRTPCRWR